MADPLDVLRQPPLPLDPEPVFAARLRARLQRVLDLPEGVTVIDLATSDRPAAPPAVLTPYLAVSGAGAALDWYVRALGARPRGEPIVMPDGRIGHAELDIDGATLMLSEEYPEIGVVAPVPGAGATVTVHLSVPDVDRRVARAVDAGARLERPPTDAPYGRGGVIRDPFGHRWMIMTEAAGPEGPGPADAEPRLRHGDIGYVSLRVPDIERAAAFYRAVLGWRYGPARAPQGRQVVDAGLPHGLRGGEAHPTMFCGYVVDDVAAAVERVRAAGGTAEGPRREPYGTVSACVDDQGQRFAVFEPPGGTVGHDEEEVGPGRGDLADVTMLAYVTMEVEDSSRARAFYGAVLGWRFAAGRVADGWQVEAVEPMVGLSGGHGRATVLPMYRVEDIAAAVARVRAAGGSATDPEAQPYGISATCVDDQGTRFYLGQL